MDYHAIHGHDVANFSTPLTHRVLTVSAAEADAALLSQSSASSTASETALPARFIPTGIETLDAILAGIEPPSAGDDEEVAEEPAVEEADEGAQQEHIPSTRAAASARPTGGVRRGQLTEIWGPPGAGKTAFGIQLAANALRNGSSAVWIDCFHSLCDERLAAVVDQQVRDVDGAQNLEDGFVHYVCPSLPHFIAMLCPPPPAQPPCIPSDASVLVIDSLSALVNYALPRTVEGKGAPLMANGKKGPAPYEKRTQVLQYVTAALERLAETRNLAVVVLTQCASRVQAERGAALTPALNAFVWDRGVSTRLVLFRDWAWKDSRPVGGRFAGVQKLDGNGSDANIECTVAFDITETGLVEEHYTAIPPRSSASIYKRKLGDTELDARGIDEEDYGWDDDDNMPSMPPQWQGSEDLLLGHRYEEEEEDEEDEEDEHSDAKRDEASEVEAAVEGGDEYGQQQIQIHRARRSSHSVADSEEDSDI